MEFRAFDKIPRLFRRVVITEKIDGTNASIYIARVAADNFSTGPLAIAYLADPPTGEVLVMYAGSRTRWITREDDNFGFAAWASDNSVDLFNLGEGHHFGEWWGKGIQRNYGLGERRFSLFNAGRWADRHVFSEDQLGDREFAPWCCHVVPVLASGVFDNHIVNFSKTLLKTRGSVAQPGFMQPEGLVLFHEASRQMFKVTLENDAEPKGKL
jgi:hypothetical protein